MGDDAWDAKACPKWFRSPAIAEKMLLGDLRLGTDRALRYCDFVWDFYHTVFEGFCPPFVIAPGDNPFPIFVQALNACMLQVMRMDGKWPHSRAGLPNPTPTQRKEMRERRKKWEHDRTVLQDCQDGSRCMLDARDALHFLVAPDYGHAALRALQIPQVPPHPFAHLMR